MVGKKKVIGIFTACLQDRRRSEFVDLLGAEAQENEWKVIVFNSPEPYSEKNARSGAMCAVFDIANFHMIDAAVIFGDSFGPGFSSDSIREAAEASGRPVFLVKETIGQGMRLDLTEADYIYDGRILDETGVYSQYGLEWLPGAFDRMNAIKENEFSESAQSNEDKKICDIGTCRVADAIIEMLDGLCRIEDIAKLYLELKDRITSDSYVCIRNDLNEADGNPELEKRLSQELTVIPSANLRKGGREYETMTIIEMIPNINDIEHTDGIWVIQALVTGGIICGYHVSRVNICSSYVDIINRKVSVLNLIFSLINKQAKHAKDIREVEEAFIKKTRSDRTDITEYMNTFELLVERNLFRYHFQPIVDAHTGDIVAYEALMRTGGGISMSPLEVLEIARKSKRLYDIEKATMFNIMGEYVDKADVFMGRSVFINTIPGYFLEDEDLKLLRELFGNWFDNFVFEVTEQNTITNDELAKIRSLCNKEQSARIAIDDYGTGHSNIVNLLRYEPHVIKIDRYLISNIQNDANKQMFVKNTIEFAARNKIKVLAEGVETAEELKRVIEYGVDYIQGYYTARPAAEPLQSLTDEIRNDIIEANLRASRLVTDRLVYKAEPDETVNLLDLALKKYNYVDVSEGTVRFVGEKSNMIDIMIKTKDNSETTLIFDNANIKGDIDTTVRIGRNSKCTIELVGVNTLNKDGIYCPDGSSLLLTGEGDLQIYSSRNYCIGIGSSSKEAYGDITVDMKGHLKIFSNGNEVTGIGGGAGKNSKIRLLGGEFDIGAKGISVVAIGSLAGDCDIYIGNVNCRLRTDGNDSICVGALHGSANIRTIGKLDIASDGESTVGIGTVNGPANISIEDNTVSAILHTYSGTGIGSINDEAHVTITSSTVSAYCEGTMLCGIGSYNGTGCTEITEGEINVEILAGVICELGSEQTQTYLNSGRVFIARDNTVTVLATDGTAIEAENVNGGRLFKA